MHKCLFVFICLYSLSINAEESVTIIKQNGMSYLCFDQDASQILLDMRLKYPLLEKENVLLKDQVKIKEEEIVKWQSGAENLTAQLAILAESNTDLQKKIESSNAWYRSNILWTAVGLVVGTGITIGVVKALNP